MLKKKLLLVTHLQNKWNQQIVTSSTFAIHQLCPPQ